jgi:hypothetical protein
MAADESRGAGDLMGAYDAENNAAMSEMGDLPEPQMRKVRKALQRAFAEVNGPDTPDQVNAAASSDPVEQAYREGKFPASRRGHWYGLLAKNSKKTRRTLASLAPVLEPPEVMEGVREFVEEAQAAPVVAAASAPSGPTDYPREWLDRGGVVGRASGVGGNIVQEPSIGGAPVAAGPGEVL